ncbi:MAG: DeoR/GlpR family DNA-binding transcription regulator [Oscillospiraceae bacterium]
MNKRDDRIIKLIELLRQRQGMTIRQLAEFFDVSEMTIRRDMDLLKRDNVILDIPGAAILNSNVASATDNYSIALAIDTHAQEKERIGRYAARLVENNDCVIIDNGTTTEKLAASLSPSIFATVLTSNLNIINTLTKKPNISIITGGGNYHSDTGLFECSDNISIIQKFRATKVFCSAAGVHETMGVTCMNSYEVATKRAILSSGEKLILLVDSSKFAQVKSCYVSDIASYDMIITDSGISDECAATIRGLCPELIIV